MLDRIYKVVTIALGLVIMVGAVIAIPMWAAGTKSDVQHLQNDVDQLQTDVDQLQTDVNQLRIDVAEIKEYQRLMLERVGYEGLFATRALTLLSGWMSYPGNRTRGHPLCGNRNLQEELV
jgi:outer membrane murein-binding lipoprotein Lpp